MRWPTRWRQKKEALPVRPAPWWFAAALAAAGGTRGAAAAWACAAACDPAQRRADLRGLGGPPGEADAVAALCGVLEEAADAAAGADGAAAGCAPAANEAAADALDALGLRRPERLRRVRSPPLPPDGGSAPSQAALTQAGLPPRRGSAVPPGAPPHWPAGPGPPPRRAPPLRLRDGAARVVAALARGPRPRPPCSSGERLLPAHDFPSSRTLRLCRRGAGRPRARPQRPAPMSGSMPRRVRALGGHPKDLAAAALKAAGAALHADAVSSGASALAALLTRRAATRKEGERGSQTGDHRATTAPTATATTKTTLAAGALARASSS